MEDTKALNEQPSKIQAESFEADFPLFSKWAERNNIFQTSLLVNFLNENNIPASSISTDGDEIEKVCFAVREYFRDLPPDFEGL